MCSPLKVLLLCMAILQSYVACSAETIRINQVNAEKDKYQLGLLKLALSYSETNYEFIQSPTSLTQTKMLSELESNKLDMAWGGTSRAYEERFLPVRVPLFKGLLGHRVFLIREGDQARFDHVSSLDDLNQFIAGQGRSWTDVMILRDAGVPLITTLKYNNLFYMLDGGRFDYLPRSVYSPWAEMAKRPELHFQVENNIMLVYPLPAYVFVNKSNIRLRNEIKTGMYKAIEDGSFDDYFYNHPLIQEGLKNSHLEKRTVFKLTNNSLTPETPLGDKRLWFNIDDYLSSRKSNATIETVAINGY